MLWIYLNKKVVLEKKSKGKHPRRRKWPRWGPKWEQQYSVVATWKEGDCERRSCEKHSRWRGLVGGGHYRKIMCNVLVLSCSFASFKVQWDILLNIAVLTDAVHHSAHTSTQSFHVYIILLCLLRSVFIVFTLILFLFSDYRHPNCAVGIWCKSNFVEVRIEYVDTMWMYTHTKICIYLNDKDKKHSCTSDPSKFGTYFTNFIILIFLSLFFGKWLKSDIVWLAIARVWVCLPGYWMQTFHCALYLWRTCIAFTRCIDTRVNSSGVVTYCKEWWDVTAQCCQVLSRRGRRHVHLQCWYLTHRNGIFTPNAVGQDIVLMCVAPSEVQFNWMYIINICINIIQDVSCITTPNTAALLNRNPTFYQDISWQLQCS